MMDQSSPLNKEWVRIREHMEAQADECYRAFVHKLVPGEHLIVGVRLPALRQMAREIAEKSPETFLRDYPVESFEDAMLKGMVIGALKKDIHMIMRETEAFLPLVNNWSVCDSFCSGLKITKRHREQVWSFVTRHITGEETYEVRMALVLMLNYYIDEVYIGNIFREIERVNHGDYYVKMAEAWLLSLCYIQFPRQTYDFLKDNQTLDQWTCSKSIQKICESHRVTAEEKIMVKALKKKG